MAPPSVLITGCSEGGIGDALAICFAARGLVVFATARNVQRMAHLAHTPNIHLLELDVSYPNQVCNVAEQISRQTNGTLDYLVNNAGQTRFMPLLDENLEQVKELFDVNVYGALRLTQACADMLIKASGKVVFISSVSGHVNVPWQGAYAGSKAALEAIADTLRVEMAPLGVRVTSVVTTGVNTRVHHAYQAWEMPKDSVYAQAHDAFVKRAKGDDGAPRLEPNAYADIVVKKVLDSNTNKFWSGAYSGMLKWMVTWLPLALLDKIIISGTGIDVMLKTEKEKNGKEP